MPEATLNVAAWQTQVAADEILMTASAIVALTPTLEPTPEATEAPTIIVVPPQQPPAMGISETALMLVLLAIVAILIGAGTLLRSVYKTMPELAKMVIKSTAESGYAYLEKMTNIPGTDIDDRIRLAIRGRMNDTFAEDDEGTTAPPPAAVQ